MLSIASVSGQLKNICFRKECAFLAVSFVLAGTIQEGPSYPLAFRFLRPIPGVTGKLVEIPGKLNISIAAKKEANAFHYKMPKFFFPIDRR